MTLGKDEIQVNGTVMSIYTGEGKLVILATSIALPNGFNTKLDPPRRKTILISQKTSITPPVSLTDPVEMVHTLRGAYVTVVGPNYGVGTQLPARVLQVSQGR